MLEERKGKRETIKGCLDFSEVFRVLQNSC